MLSEKEKLNKLTNLGIELNQIRDLDILMERVLRDARIFVNADAGSIYIRDKDTLLFTYTQNVTLQKRLPLGEKLIYSTFTLPIDTASIAGYAATTGKPLNISNVYEIDPSAPYQFSRQFDESSGYETKSMIAVPLKTARGDVYDALSSARVYKEAWDESEVLSTIKKESGHQFDPELVEIFFSRLNILRAIQERYKG